MTWARRVLLLIISYLFLLLFLQGPQPPLLALGAICTAAYWALATVELH